MFAYVCLSVSFQIKDSAAALNAIFRFVHSSIVWKLLDHVVYSSTFYPTSSTVFANAVAVKLNWSTLSATFLTVLTSLAKYMLFSWTFLKLLTKLITPPSLRCQDYCIQVKFLNWSSTGSHRAGPCWRRTFQPQIYVYILDVFK